MKRLLLTGFLVGLAFPLLAAETVSTISFNPSRLGQYTYLKINKDINLKGGLQVTDVTHLNTPASDTGELVFATSNNGNINITSVGNIVFEIPNLTSKSSATNSVSVYMPNAVFQKSSSEKVGTVEMTGGTMNMSAGTDASTINTLTNATGGMVMSALSGSGILLTQGPVSITGDPSANSNSGLTLGNIRIPKPGITFNKYCWKAFEGADGSMRVFALCVGSEEGSASPASASYKWKISGSSSGVVNFNSGSHSNSTVNYWMAQYSVVDSSNVDHSESREGTSSGNMGESSMGGSYSGYLSRIVQGAFSASAANTICKDMFAGVTLAMVTTTEPTSGSSCSTKGEKKVYAVSNYTTYRNTLKCILYECK